MRRVIKWLEATETFVDQDYDRLVPVVGDEGKGKSTLMTACGWIWRDIIGREQTVDAAMGQIAWNNDMFKEYISNKERKSCIIIHDAARVLSRKKAMHGDQIEVEEDLLDARFGNYLMLLGYQEFDLVPTMLATRRAKNMLYVPERGIVHGYNEDGIRKRYETDEWPDPVLRDTFPDLEGTELWSRFESEDQRRKKERIHDEGDDAQKGAKELADEILEDGSLARVISIHGGHNKPYIDADMIEIEYETSGRLAKKTAKVLKKRVPQHKLEAMGA